MLAAHVGLEVVAALVDVVAVGTLAALRVVGARVVPPIAHRLAAPRATVEPATAYSLLEDDEHVVVLTLRLLLLEDRLLLLVLLDGSFVIYIIDITSSHTRSSRYHHHHRLICVLACEPLSLSRTISPIYRER